MIYFIAADEVGLVKIGHARDPSLRLSEFRTSSPVELRLLGVLPGGRAVEGALHHRFRTHRVRGEWFRAHDELTALAIGRELPDDLVALRDVPEPQRKWSSQTLTQRLREIPIGTSRWFGEAEAGFRSIRSTLARMKRSEDGFYHTRPENGGLTVWRLE